MQNLRLIPSRPSLSTGLNIASNFRGLKAHAVDLHLLNLHSKGSEKFPSNISVPKLLILIYAVKEAHEGMLENSCVVPAFPSKIVIQFLPELWYAMVVRSPSQGFIPGSISGLSDSAPS